MVVLLSIVLGLALLWLWASGHWFGLLVGVPAWAVVGLGAAHVFLDPITPTIAFGAMGLGAAFAFLPRYLRRDAIRASAPQYPVKQ